MKFKSKNLDWLAGRPVVILGEEISKKMNVHVNDRISIRHGQKKVYAVVDIFPSAVKKNEIGLSHEISTILKTHKSDSIDAGTSDGLIGGRLIRKKLHNEKLTAEEIMTLIQEISSNNLTEAELAYFVSAEKIHGMSDDETIALTDAMVKTGKKLNWGNQIIADKHCIGGIAGNRTTPIVVAICAAAGLKLPKSSSRAITSASGTADVIETLANVELSLEEIKKVVEKTNACLVWGGALGLAPSDDKIIQVERLLNLDVEPQLLSSILSKKIAAGSNHILIDIPYGGGKMKTIRDAKKLGKKFKKLAKHFNVKVKPAYTLGIEPIGNGFGPVLEMQDVISVLQNKKDCPQDLKEKSLFLSKKLLSLCGVLFPGHKARKMLESGMAYEKFKEIINAQNKSNDFDKRVKNLKLAKYQKIIYTKKTGEIIKIDNSKMNSLCRVLGTPETISAGVYLHSHLGKVEKGQKILTLYSESKQRLQEGLKFIQEFDPINIK